MSADDTVRQKIDQHKQAILLMSQSDAELTAAVPSGAISTVLADNPVIQELKQLCEQAETLKAERDVIESELRNSNASLSSRFMAALADSGAINAEVSFDWSTNQSRLSNHKNCYKYKSQNCAKNDTLKTGF